MSAFPPSADGPLLGGRSGYPDACGGTRRLYGCVAFPEGEAPKLDQPQCSVTPAVRPLSAEGWSARPAADGTRWFACRVSRRPEPVRIRVRRIPVLQECESNSSRRDPQSLRLEPDRPVLKRTLRPDEMQSGGECDQGRTSLDYLRLSGRNTQVGCICLKNRRFLGNVSADAPAHAPPSCARTGSNMFDSGSLADGGSRTQAATCKRPVFTTTIRSS